MNMRKHRKFKENKKLESGITLVILVVSVVILLIIAGVSITGTMQENDKVEEAKLFSELNMVQHAILEKYTKEQIIQGSLPGTTITMAEVQQIIDNMNTSTGENIELKGKETDYKKLRKEDLEKIGITGSDTYIINYITGEVINETIKTTKTGKALYTYAKNKE